MKIITACGVVVLLSVPGVVRAQEANSVYIDQIGDVSKVTIIQEGSRNRVGESATVRAILGGARGPATITQRGNENAVSRFVTVEDGGNVLNLLQQGDRNSYSYGRTVGANNTISLNQIGSGNDAVTWIGGEANLLTILQEGRDNTASLAAAGSENRLTAASKGDRNKVEMTAAGSRNVLSVTQQGSGHAVVVNQTGSGAALSIMQR